LNTVKNTDANGHARLPGRLEALWAEQNVTSGS